MCVCVCVCVCIFQECYHIKDVTHDSDINDKENIPTNVSYDNENFALYNMIVFIRKYIFVLQ